MSAAIRYVAGFLFDDDREHVALIKKLKPAWMAGKLNAIGGKIEPGESDVEAMEREFHEETGVIVRNWEQFCVLRHSNKFEVVFYRAFAPLETVKLVQSKEEEQVRVQWLRMLPLATRMVNLDWLISMALSMDQEQAASFEITERAA